MKLCLGTVQFGLNYGIENKKIDKKEINDILRTALKNNILMLDTAQNYGNSEELIGEFKEREKFKIITKISSLSLKNRNRLKETENLLGNSLEKLKISSLDGVLLHNPTDLNEYDFLSNLESLKKKNYFSNLGVSIYSIKEANEALENRNIDYIQVPYNILDTRLDKINFFLRAKEKNKKVFVRSIFLQGTLLKEQHKYPKYLDELKIFDNLIQKEINKLGCTKLEYLISFIKYKKNIDYIIVGIEKLKDLEEIIEAYHYKNLEGYDFEILRENFKDIPENILNPSLWGK